MRVLSAGLVGVALLPLPMSCPVLADTLPRLTVGPLLGGTSSGDFIGGLRAAGGLAKQLRAPSILSVVAVGGSAAALYVADFGWQVEATCDLMWWPGWSGWSVFWIARAGPGYRIADDAWTARAEVALGNQHILDLFVRVEAEPRDGPWLFLGGFELALYTPFLLHHLATPSEPAAK